MERCGYCAGNSRWACCIGNNLEIREALSFPEVPTTKERISKLLVDIERSFAQGDKDVLKSKDVQNYASHLNKNLDKVLFGAQSTKDALNALGTLHWKPHIVNEGSVSDYMAESLDIIIEGYLICKALSKSGAIKRFLCASIHAKEIETWKKKLEYFLLKANAVMTTALIEQFAQPPPIVATRPVAGIVGIEERKRDVLKLLKLEDKAETRVVVVYGMGGLGKSILVDAIYNEVVKDELTRVLTSEGANLVFIYIDNVLQQQDLEKLLPIEPEQITLPKESRWLITTRDESVCTRVFTRNQGYRVEKYNMKLLNDRDAEKLFYFSFIWARRAKLTDESWKEVKWLRVPALEDGVEAELLENCRELEVMVLDTHVNERIADPPQQLKVVISCSPIGLQMEADELEELVYLDVCLGIDEELWVAPSTRKLQVISWFRGATISKAALRDFRGSTLPQEMGSLTSLEILDISSDTLEELPQSLGHLTRLQRLDPELPALKEMRSGVLGGRMKELEFLRLDLGAVKYDVCLKLEKLRWFRLAVCEQLCSLKGVQSSCPSLECLQLVSLEKVEVLLPKFITGCTTSLRNLQLLNCLALQELCAETEMLQHLEMWVVYGCPELKAIPEGLMERVERLALLDCPALRALPTDLDGAKAGSMHLLACDTHLLPPHFLPLPPVVPYKYTVDDIRRAAQYVDYVVCETVISLILQSNALK
ncbi:hypothetical protein GOP47_0029264 [Adiantum capillus-veneris]|nr:hypothetical protein GOP47_0029264 [Adiantum capillus-veneris]